MTKEEANTIRAQLEKLGLSQRAAASQLEIAERTMRRYCSGEADVPRVIFLALHLIELAQKDEKQREWLAKYGVRLGYNGQDITAQESGRLANRATANRSHAKKIVKTKR